MNPFTLLARAQARTGPTGMPLPGAHSGHESLTGPDASPKPSPASLAPCRRPPLPEQCDSYDPSGPVWPSPRTWETAEFTTRDQIREAVVLDRLAGLTRRHDSPLIAARSLYAPELLETTE